MSDPVRLFVVWFMGLIKGAILSGLLLLPFFGPWAMAAGTLAFSFVCLGLALKRADCPGGVCAPRARIRDADSCTPKVQRW